MCNLASQPRLYPIVAAVVVCTAACGDTALVLEVIARDGVNDAVDLEVTLSSSVDEDRTTVLSPDDQAPLFTANERQVLVNILANDRRGPVDVVVRARDAAQTVVGEGQSTITLISREVRQATVWLDPTDFATSSQRPEEQFFSSTAVGRQVAATSFPDENRGFVAIWRTCVVRLGCHATARLFAPGAVPRVRDGGDSDEFLVGADNQGSQGIGDMPAVAMAKDGSFIAVWAETGETARGVFIRAVAPDGSITADAAVARRLSNGGHQTASPDAAALRSDSTAGYVIVWAESANGEARIVGRLVNDKGAPQQDSGATDEPFEIAASTAGTSADDTRPAVAASSKGFMVAWISGGNVLVRTFGHDATALSKPRPAASISTGKAKSVDLIGYEGGYAVVWNDVHDKDDDRKQAVHLGVRMRRFGPKGETLDNNATTLSTSAAADQLDPTIAVRADGSFVVAWTTDESSVDPDGGIRARRVLRTGLPVGNELAVNTKREARQSRPSIAAVGEDAFIVVFQDGAKDDVRADIRGRLIYPDFDIRDSTLGALCDDGSLCHDGLACTAAAPVGRRCLERCTSPGSPCENGGSCTETAPEEHRCLFQQ